MKPPRRTRNTAAPEAPAPAAGRGSGANYSAMSRSLVPDSGKASINELNNAMAVLTLNADLMRGQLEAAGAGPGLQSAFDEVYEAMQRLAAVISRQNRVPEAATRPPVAVPEPRRSGAPIRILILDDDVALTRALKRLLAGYEVTTANDGAKALKRIEGGERFDFILCDIAMPVLSGDEFYERLRRLDAEQADQVVFLTGGATTERSRKFLRHVPNLVLAKPYDAMSLRELVVRRLGRGEP